MTIPYCLLQHTFQYSVSVFRLLLPNVNKQKWHFRGTTTLHSTIQPFKLICKQSSKKLKLKKGYKALHVRLLEMTDTKQCLLRKLEDESVAIFLKHGQQITIGRCPATNIRDKRCSKSQVSVCADYNLETVTVKNMGGNPSSANGFIIRDNTAILNNGDVLELLVGKHKFKVEFQTPDTKPEETNESIDLLEEDECSMPKRVCKEVNNFARASSAVKSTWEKVEDGKLYVFTSVGVLSSEKIAAYDMDGTVILTKSGRVFPKDKDDWILANSQVKSKLSGLFVKGYKIVILTNQAGIGRGKTNINEFKYKIENILKALAVPVQVFISSTNSIFRKPAPGMWTYLETKKNDGIKIKMSESFFVGDAAGRIANWSPGKKKDFSSADRLLALNLKLRFQTPEEHFCNEPPGKFVLPQFNPGALDENTPLADGEIVSKSKEVVLMIGAPGSGKSHFACTHLVSAGYTHVNRDLLGSWQKCVLNMEAAVAAGRSVVIDNTNPDRASRKRFLDRVKVPCRCFLMTTSPDHVRHNNRFRELTDTKHVPVHEMVINSYKNKFEAPSLEEGFTEIVTVNFVPSFTDPELKKLYQMYLLEK